MKENREKRCIERMERLQRFRSRFSDKQIHTITAILILIWIAKGIFIPIVEPIYKFAIIFIGVMLIIIIIEMFIFDMDTRKNEEEEEELRNKIPERFHLKKNEFVEVLLSPYTDTIPGDAVMEAVEDLRAVGIKYYAKINEDNTEITVIKKEKDGKELGKPIKISSFTYFEANYKPK